MLKRFLPSLVTAVLVVLVQLVLTTAGVQFYLTQLTMAAYYSLLALGLCMLMGYAGQISLGQAGFFAIGGYTVAVLTKHFHWSPWLACITAIVLTIIIAFLIGIPVLKLKGHYLAMATLGFGLIIYRIVLGTKLFGEADGITDIPGFTLIPGLTVNGDFNLRVENYYIAWGVLIIGMLLLSNLIHSRVGRALRYIHGNEEAAKASGVNTPAYKLKVFVLSAVFASVAGIFLTHYNGGIGPTEAGAMKSVRYVAIVAVGGMANLTGTLVMGTILNFLSLRGVFGTYDDAVFGLILIIMMIFAPEGLTRIGLIQNIKHKVVHAAQTMRKRGDNDAAS